jgi:UDP-N-acetylglucosamine/UDP-N-acetylgalactosamine diphosphorylase
MIERCTIKAPNSDEKQRKATMTQVDPSISDVCSRLEAAGQSHLSHYLRGVTPSSAQEAIVSQIDELDLDELSVLIQKYISSPEPEASPGEIKPAPCYLLEGHGPSGEWDRRSYQEQGDALIRAGKVACFTVAGGQGSRLGYDGPKGCFPTSCVNEKPLFQLFAESIRANELKYGCTIPWYIMTSPLNHDATVSFFESHDYFGLGRGQIMFFNQGVMPSLDAESGEILMRDPMHLATNPDGHGGSFKALGVSGALEDMKRRGIEHVSYFQVDNPQARVVDPVFIGLHAFAPDSSGEFSSKMVAKATWDEKVGVFCSVDGRTEIIEYSDLDEDLAKQTDADGRLAFIAGSIAIHIISVGFIERVLHDADATLPYHKALKKVPHFDLRTGQAVTPEQNNAVKLEKFVFDGIPIASGSIVVETDRVEEFAPVKNATGTDSIVSSMQLQSQRAARWLSAHGVSVPMNSDGSVNATIEISSFTATCEEDLEGKDLPGQIEPGSTVEL